MDGRIGGFLFPSRGPISFSQWRVITDLIIHTLLAFCCLQSFGDFPRVLFLPGLWFLPDTIFP